MKKKILIAVMACIIIVGFAMIGFVGLNFDINYTANKEIDIYLGTQFEISDIRGLVKEVIGNEATVIQKVELYEEIVSIKVKEISDEQIEQLLTKINEKYNLEIKKDDITIANNPNLRGRELVKPYILPIAISVVLVLVYAGIKFYRVNSIEVISKLIGLNIIAQLFYVSVLAITRLPVNRLTIPVSIAIYIATTLAVTINFENKEIVKEKKKNK